VTNSPIAGAGDEMDEIVTEFLVESHENLDRLDRDLVELEKDPSNGERLASIFRTIHTIKGTSGFLGFGQLEKLAHSGENLLSELRDGELTLGPEITSALLAMVDAVRDMLSHIEADSTEGQRDDVDLIAKIGRLVGGELGEGEERVERRPIGELLVDAGHVDVDTVHKAVIEQERGDPRHIGEILVDRGLIDPQAVVEALQTQQAQVEKSSGVSEANVRVDVGLLDTLMNLVGELVLARNQILQFTASSNGVAGLADTTQRLNLITTELQEGVMKTRMQPIGNVWSRFPRTVRDLALTCGKQVRLEMEGKETELDRTIVEAIRDPLTHLVRNSVDHGIEPPEERVRLGKRPEGRLLLRAFHEGGRVNIEISDDGGGLKLERIKAKALERRLVTSEQLPTLSEREVSNLIFLPGFSTAAAVTNLSGRGVGMDVVKTNIEKIGGTIDLSSVEGSGTTFKIKIPLTLAIIPALVVACCGQRYAIPQVSLLELVRLDGEATKAIEYVADVPVYRLRGQLLPLVSLAEQLGVADEGSGARVMVVLQAEGRPFGLIVHEVHDTEEIVVKPLGRQLKGITTFSGATIMGDGRVALILDVVGLAHRAGVGSEGEASVAHGADRDEVVADRSTETLLLLAAGSRGRLAVPLSRVDRLEEIDPATVERAGADEAVRYRGGIMPLVPLGQMLGVGDDAGGDGPLQVVVHRCGDRCIGLVVDRILDIVEDHVVLDRTTARRGTLGSAIVSGQISEVVDVDAIVGAYVPDLAEADHPTGVEG